MPINRCGYLVQVMKDIATFLTMKHSVCTLLILQHIHFLSFGDGEILVRVPRYVNYSFLVWIPLATT